MPRMLADEMLRQERLPTLIVASSLARETKCRPLLKIGRLTAAELTIEPRASFHYPMPPLHFLFRSFVTVDDPLYNIS